MYPGARILPGKARMKAPWYSMAIVLLGGNSSWGIYMLGVSSLSFKVERELMTISITV